MLYEFIQNFVDDAFLALAASVRALVDWTRAWTWSDHEFLAGVQQPPLWSEEWFHLGEDTFDRGALVCGEVRRQVNVLYALAELIVFGLETVERV